jgi:DNA primase
MHVSLIKNVVHCFKCGYGGSWITFVMDVLKCNYFQAVSELYVVPKIRKDIAETLVEQLQKKSIIRHEKTDLQLPYDFQLLKDSHSDAAKQAIRYMSKTRGFSKEDWEFYNIGICMATLPMRVVIPVEDGYYQARAIPEWLEPKYKNPKSEARYYLFNSAALELYDEVVICEGAFSAMAVGRNAVALLGKELPIEKLERLLESGVKKFIVALDYGAGKFAVEVSDSLHKGGKEVSMWKFKDERDPADGGEYEELPYDFGAKLKMMF